MFGTRHWFATLALTVAPSLAFAQPVFQGGTVVGNNPSALVPDRPVISATSMAMPVPPPAPVGTIPGAMAAPAPGTVPPPPVPGVVTASPHIPAGNPWAIAGKECCGPMGANGPIGQEVYFRAGTTMPFGSGPLANSLDIGWTGQVGVRSELFDPSGTSAWAIDAHLYYAYNNASGQDLVFVRDILSTIRSLHRWAGGLAVGRDYFMTGPGFVGGMWDANLRYGCDLGGRYGSGHIDAQPITDPTGYIRKQDQFGQIFLAGHGNIEVPTGAWTFLAGGRLELNYTSGKFLVSQNSFYDFSLLFTVGVRY